MLILSWQVLLTRPSQNAFAVFSSKQHLCIFTPFLCGWISYETLLFSEEVDQIRDELRGLPAKLTVWNSNVSSEDIPTKKKKYSHKVQHRSKLLKRRKDIKRSIGDLSSNVYSVRVMIRKFSAAKFSKLKTNHKILLLYQSWRHVHKQDHWSYEPMRYLIINFRRVSLMCSYSHFISFHIALGT